MAGWLGQVGAESQSRAPGSAIRTSSSPCRIAPVPPGVATQARRSLGRSAPSTSSESASAKPGSPARPV